MADESTSAIEPAQPRFQFRLRSIFILMMITAFSLGIVPIWYQQVIIPASRSAYMQDLTFYDYQVYQSTIAKRFTPFFSIVAFVSCCGLWYTIASSGGRRSDYRIGLAFGHTFGLLFLPEVWVSVYLLCFTIVAFPFRSTLPFSNFYQLLPFVIFLALLYAAWPLYIKRYWAAFLLFLYSSVFGFYALSYARYAMTTLG